MKSLTKLVGLLNGPARLRGSMLLVLIVIGAGLEAGGAGLIFPFISIVGQPELIHERSYLRWMYETLGVGSSRAFLVWAAIALLCFYLLKNAYAAWLLAAQNRFVYRNYVEQSSRLLQAYLSRPWSWHLQQNSAELLRSVNTDVLNVFSNLMVPLLVVVSEVTIAAAVLAVLVIVAPLPALVVLALVGGTSAAFYSIIRRRLERLGRNQQQEAGEMIKWINQALGGIKEAKVLGREDYFLHRYDEGVRAFAEATEYALTVNQLPRLFIETVAVAAMLLIVVIMLARGNEGGSLLPLLGLFAMASFRLIPSVNRVVGSITRIVYHRAALDVVHRDLKELGGELVVLSTIREGDASALSLREGIELADVSFWYPSATDPALRHVSLDIPHGRAAAFVGPSGAGKTTLVDVIIGLLPPSSGRVLADGVDVYEDVGAWRRAIGYVPQSIYLSDDSILSNVAFGVSDGLVDEARVRQVLKLVQLEELVETLPDGLQTFVGERGVRLSGGQRQRIGIARALYHDPHVLVMDEATSALDLETERAITSAMQHLVGVKTLILIAHHKETIEYCDLVFHLVRGELQGCSKRS